MTQNLLPSPFPFASSHIARPVLSGSGSTYAAAAAQQAANARVQLSLAQGLAPHAGARVPSAIQTLQSQNAFLSTGSSLTESKTVIVQLLLRRFSYENMAHLKSQQRSYQAVEEISSKFSICFLCKFFRTNTNSHV